MSKKITSSTRLLDILLIVLIVAFAIRALLFNSNDKSDSSTTTFAFYRLLDESRDTDATFARKCLGEESEFTQMLNKEKKLATSMSIKYVYHYADKKNLDLGDAGYVKSRFIIDDHLINSPPRTQPIYIAKRNGIEGLNEGEFQMITLKNSGFHDLKDLQNKVIATPNLENLSAIPINYFLSLNEVNFASISTYHNLDEAFSMLKNKKVDSIIIYLDKSDVISYFKSSSNKLGDFNILYTSSINFPPLLIYVSEKLDKNKKVQFDKLINSIFNDPAKKDLFTKCTYMTSIEKITDKKWQDILNILKKADTYQKSKSAPNKIQK